MFKKYQHVERFGTDEVDGIEMGTCYVFPKIDGTNGSIWFDGRLRAGSRNRELTPEKDNADFFKSILANEPLVETLMQEVFMKGLNWTIYGEWLVKHSLTTYREDAWKKFYVFDVYDNDTEQYIPFGKYYGVLQFVYGLEVIPAIAIVKDGKQETFEKLLEKNTYLIEDGKGIGEGIVIKNYDFRNKFGRQTWAKIVTTEFKEKNLKAFGPNIIKTTAGPEELCVEKFCTEAFIQKEFAKVAIDGWNSGLIPKLLGTVWHSFVTEHTWQILKEYKNPVIDFGRLQKIVTTKIKYVLHDKF